MTEGIFSYPPPQIRTQLKSYDSDRVLITFFLEIQLNVLNSTGGGRYIMASTWLGSITA